MLVRFINSKQIAKETMSFSFSRPNKFYYLPGQYVYLTLPNLKSKDYRGSTRQFTLSSSPGNIKELTITTRLQSNSVYKKTLINLKVDDKVELEGPTGTFILDEKIKGEIVFLAGGIGITPFISSFRYHKEKRLKRKLTLIYTNSTRKEISFYEELDSYSGELPSLKCLFSLTSDKIDPTWSHLRGRVNIDMVKSIINRENRQTFFICGPPGFVDASENILKQLRIKSKHINTEKFTGY